MSNTVKKWFDEARYISDDNGFSLDLPEVMSSEMPGVSIITILTDPKCVAYVGLMLYNWNHIKYPKNKLEWIIYDRSGSKYSLGPYLPIPSGGDSGDESYVVYVREDPLARTDVGNDDTETLLSTAECRNRMVERARFDVIAFYEMSHYYSQESLLAKVRILEKYKKDYLFSTPIGRYNAKTNECVIVGSDYVLKGVPDASVLFRRSFWQTHRFVAPTSPLQSDTSSFIDAKTVRNGIKVNFLFNTIECIGLDDAKDASARPVASTMVKSANELVKILTPELLYGLNNVRGLIQ